MFVLGKTRCGEAASGRNTMSIYPQSGKKKTAGKTHETASAVLRGGGASWCLHKKWLQLTKGQLSMGVN